MSSSVTRENRNSGRLASHRVRLGNGPLEPEPRALTHTQLAGREQVTFLGDDRPASDAGRGLGAAGIEPTRNLFDAHGLGLAAHGCYRSCEIGFFGRQKPLPYKTR
jgi:hypothetical protein